MRTLLEAANRFLGEDEDGNEAYDKRYEAAQQEPLKTKIKDMLVNIFKDKDFMVKIADNYEWKDGSNGYINFSSLNHYINDMGYRAYAENPEVLDSEEELKEHLRYEWTSTGTEFKKGEKYRDFEYNPEDEFRW